MLYILPVVAIAIIFVFASWYYSEKQKIMRFMRKTPLCSIRDAKAGSVVRLVGRVRSNGQLIESPISHRKCVYYNATVEEYRSSGKTGQWVQIIREFNAVDFLLLDDTGRALVRTAAIKSLVVRDTERKSGMLNDPAPDLESFLTRHGHRSTGWIFNKNIRYREGIFDVDETIAVVGTVRWEHDPESEHAGKGYRDMPKRAVIEPLPDGFVLASDEWETTV